MLSYSNTIAKRIKRNPDSFIESFKMNVLAQLKALECRTEIQENIIHFERIVRYFPMSGGGNPNLLKLLRDGSIKIEKLDIQRIRITWVVKLDALLFISIIIGIVLGFFFGFASMSFPIFLVIAIFSPSIPYCAGYFLLKEEIDEIIYSSLVCTRHK